MEELIKIQKTEKGEVVSARDLHTFLKVKSKFNTWIKNRIKTYDFVENEDFVTVSKKMENGGRTIEYAITLDMARELSMVQNNIQGKTARKYFIKCEKIAKQYGLLSEHEKNGLKRHNQVEGTFDVRQTLIDRFGSKGVSYFIWWSKFSHKQITGRTTHQTKALGKKLNLKSKERASAKEIVRNIEPANGFGLYVSDLAVVGGAGSDLAVNIGKAAAKTIKDKAPLVQTITTGKPF